MNAYDIILRPATTEKFINLMDNEKYTFSVLLTATKAQVRNAVEEIFNVKVRSVNIMDVHDKDKKVGHYTGKIARHRKTTVTLTGDSDDIKVFAEEDNE